MSFLSRLVLFGSLLPLSAAADVSLDSASTWRLYWANDVLVKSDNQFTNGLSIEKHSPWFSRFDDTTGTPAFGKRLARALLPESNGLAYRESWGFGQNMQTPEDIGRADLITDDVPYAAMLGWANTFVAADDRRFTGFEMLFGWLGPGAFGGATQRLVHDGLGGDDPRGWDNQLDNEPIVNFYYMKKRKLVNARHFDVSVDFDAALGNFFSFGQGGLEMRVGRRPSGFAFVPGPIGRSMSYDATIRRSGERFLYGSLTLRATRLLLALPRQGNNFSDSNPWTELHTTEMEKRVGQIILGVHFEQPRWSAHLTYWRSTNTIERNSLTPIEDADNTFAAISFERRG